MERGFCLLFLFENTHGGFWPMMVTFLEDMLQIVLMMKQSRPAVSSKQI